MNCLDILSTQSSFNFTDFSNAYMQCGYKYSEPALRKKLQECIKNNSIVRVDRGLYTVSTKNKSYTYQYSDLASSLADTLQEKHPYLDFSILELIQLNEFLNYKIAHNVIFLSVDDDVIDFVFDTLKEAYPGKVLLSPTSQLYHQYWSDNMIVLSKLVTEAPKGTPIKWHTRIEKLLVDIISEPLISESISSSEYPTIFEDAYDRYIIMESTMLRYARRRTCEEKIKKFTSYKR